MKLLDFVPGTRIELHPGTDQWIMGDRFGEITYIGRSYLHVKMDRSGRTLKVPPEHVMRTIDSYGDSAWL